MIKGGKYAPCYGELIIVKCSVRDTILRWRIGEVSFNIPGTKRCDFFAGPNQEGEKFILPTANGDIIFYQNATCIASNGEDTSIDSEMYFYLNGMNEYIQIHILFRNSSQDPTL